MGYTPWMASKTSTSIWMANHISACFNLGILGYFGHLWGSKISMQRTLHFSAANADLKCPTRVDIVQPALIPSQVSAQVFPTWGSWCCRVNVGQGVPVTCSQIWNDLKWAPSNKIAIHHCFAEIRHQHAGNHFDGFVVQKSAKHIHLSPHCWSEAWIYDIGYWTWLPYQHMCVHALWSMAGFALQGSNKANWWLNTLWSAPSWLYRPQKSWNLSNKYPGVN